MSTASRHAYDTIIPELPAREAAVLGVLLKNAEGDWPGSIKRGPHGMTNREIAGALGLERDSVSPRTARLRQKGLVVEAGIKGKETLYEIALEPNFVKSPGSRMPKAYLKGIDDARELLAVLSLSYPEGSGEEMALDRGIEKLLRLKR